MSGGEQVLIPPVARAKKRGRWFLIGALAVAASAFALITAGGIGKNLVYYWGPTELHAAGADVCHRGRSASPSMKV